MKKILSLLSGLGLAISGSLLPAQTADAAPVKRCGVSTTWRTGGVDDDGASKVRLSWKYSGKSQIAVCVESWDMKKTPYSILTAASTDQTALGSWWFANSGYKLFRINKSSFSWLYVETGVALPEDQGGRHVAWVWWEKP